jgi:hypothetical protein
MTMMTETTAVSNFDTPLSDAELDQVAAAGGKPSLAGVGVAIWQPPPAICSSIYPPPENRRLS